MTTMLIAALSTGIKSAVQHHHREIHFGRFITAVLDLSTVCPLINIESTRRVVDLSQFRPVRAYEM